MTAHQLPGFVRVEIDGGVITSTTVADQHGTRRVSSEVGKTRYFIDVVEADGTRIGMWDGTDYDQAVREARLLAIDFDGRVIDRTGGAA